jgi:hypothetical protein
MTMLPFKLMVDALPVQFLFTVRGELAANDMDGARTAHNMAAGSDQGVAAARAFSDLAHAVFVPVEPPKKGAGELLIIDYWNNPEGIGRFFSDPQVQKGGAMLFSQREAAIWQSSPGLPRCNLPAPAGRSERFVGLARGAVKSREAAEGILAEALRAGVNQSRAKGLMSREWYFRLAGAGERPSLEAIGVDVWFDADGMREVYANPAEMKHFDGLFTGRPELSVWQKPKGHWVEW